MHLRGPRAHVLVSACIALAGLAACGAEPRAPAAQLTITDVGRYDFVGGGSDDPERVAEELSGLDRLSGNTYLAVSDEHACVFPLTIEVDSVSGAITSAAFLEPLELLDAQGADITGAVGDREGVAIDHKTNSVWISHEQTGGANTHSTICSHSLSTGKLSRLLVTDSIPSFAVFAEGRTNRGLESLAGRPDGAEYWTANEEALLADGDLSTAEQGTTVRLQRFDGDFKPLAQYAYIVEATRGAITTPAPLARDGMRGVSDLELLPDGTLFVLERAFDGDADGFAGNTIGIYQVDVSGATDVSGVPALRGAKFTPVEKKLLIELYFPLSNSNFEGITLGPRLENGDYSLILIADNHSGTYQALYALRLGGVGE